MNWRLTHKCVAITAGGERCNRKACCAYPIAFEWGPVSGIGIGAPYATLCRMHDYLWGLESSERVEVVGGWMGRAWNPEANCPTVLVTIYKSRESEFASPHWWRLHKPIRFGIIDETTYDEAQSGVVRD